MIEIGLELNEISSQDKFMIPNTKNYSFYQPYIKTNGNSRFQHGDHWSYRRAGRTARVPHGRPGLDRVRHRCQ